MKFSFFEEPTAVYEYLKSKKPEIHFDYDEIMHDAHKKAFTVAKMMNLDLLKDTQASLTKAFKEGVGFDEWKKSVKPMLAKKGWLGNIKVKDPKTGEEKEIYVGNRRLRTIFNTNMRTAYAKARYESQMQSLGEYFRYTAVLDGRTREAHRKLHGKTLPKTDKFWDTNYPPNGWGCRCKVQVLTEAECVARGIVPLADGSFLPQAAEKDFKYNPGKVDKTDEILKDKQDKVLDAVTSSLAKKNLKQSLDSFEHERDVYVWQKSLDDAVDELLVKKNLKAPIVAFALGKLGKDVIKKSEKLLGVKIETEYIAGDKHGILHIRPERKGQYGQDLRIEEIKKIVKILADDKTPVSVDTVNKNIVFWFEDGKDASKINKIVIDLNYKLKKFGLTNYMATASKVDKTNEKEAQFIKIR
ncbi:phage minor head protein [Campylobacter showae]|uniref:phage head morphogenesis protein n=1 Tax=Campylobacter showae TaxID=204 RepID=UPI0028D23D00|nr:phage minor head protein [Campylobacter showae]